MPDRSSLFVGRSGELAVLSEFMSRGYNVATPEIDLGEDVFVIEDDKQDFWPIQIKTATAVESSDGSCSGQFKFRRDQLVSTRNLELTYVLTLRRQGKWASFLIIPREELYDRYASGELGKQEGEQLTWNFRYDRGGVTCQKCDFSKFERAWDLKWPDILNTEIQTR